MLSTEQTRELMIAAKQGDDYSKTVLLTKNAPLIKSIIKRYIGKGVDYDDLFQLGCLGFVKAINKYDASYNVKFTTYAVPLIAGEVKRFLRDDGVIKVSRSTKGLYVRIKKFLALRGGDEHPPTLEEIAKELEVTPEEVVYATEAAQMPLALYEKSERPGDGEGLSLAERIPAPEGMELVDRIMIKNMLSALDVRERKVIILRYFRNQTQAQVASAMGISQVQVSRIEQRVIAMLRGQFQEGSG